MPSVWWLLFAYLCWVFGFVVMLCYGGCRFGFGLLFGLWCMVVFFAGFSAGLLSGCFGCLYCCVLVRTSCSWRFAAGFAVDVCLIGCLCIVQI